MLDRRYIADHIEEIRQNNAARNVQVDLDRFVELERESRRLKTELAEVNQQANEHARSMRSKGPPGEADLERGRALKERRATIEGTLRDVDAEVLELQRAIPNLTDPRAPVGLSDEANVVIGHGSAPVRELGFPAKDHVELGERHGLFDFEAGSRVAGHGFYYLKGDAVLLDLALQQYAIGVIRSRGYQVVATPDLARLELIAGTGFNPRGADAQIYAVEGTDLGLIATAEITLAGMYADSMIDEQELPLRLGGLSHCFRTEAGAHGRAGRGLYRVHQFSKVEMFAFTRPEESEAVHDEMRAIEEAIFDGLGIPFRVIENATGDLGGPAYRKFDLEAWMPGRSAYGEVTSASNCTDYQARRLNVRMRAADTGKSLGFVHTLNGTAVATGRAIIAIVENFQQADGTIAVPEPLQAVVGKPVIGAAAG